MNKKQQYLIPAGTLVNTRNVEEQLRLQPYLTRQDLWFDKRLNTGDGGFISYFRFENWLIAVETDSVQKQPRVELRAAS